MADTGPAKLPGLAAVSVQGNAALTNWVRAVTERLEVREGARGNAMERVVTQRELAQLKGSVEYLTKDKTQAGSATDVVLPLGNGMSATVAIAAFEDAIRSTRLYQDLLRRLDDPDRFNDLPEEVRAVLLSSLEKEAAERGAEISRVERIAQSYASSLSVQVETLTAAVQQAASAVREVRYAYATAGSAQAGQVTQLIASLGNYYQDGTPGRAILEQQMTVSADRIQGLRSQYTLKVQAGGALAGFGIAATEVNGVPSSAFIISAEKFAIVSPTYSGGLTTTPDTNHIPFGVDANGIYLNHNVYIRGDIRVDTGGRRLVDGLRGSLALRGTASFWSDSLARQLVWQALGYGSAPIGNNHLVIGDQVTLASADGSYVETRYWMGSYWDAAGMVLNGSLLVNGSVAAQKIDTRGLDIKDANGNVIFSSGTKLDISRIQGLEAALAQQQAVIGQTVKMPDGSVLGVGDFVNRLSRISAGTISTFMDTAAIGTAYIGNAAVGTLQIGNNAVTIPASGTSGSGSAPSCAMYLPFAGPVLVIATVSVYETSGSDGGAVVAAYSTQINAVTSDGTHYDSGGFIWNHSAHARFTVSTTAAKFERPAGWNFFQAGIGNFQNGSFSPAVGTIIAIGTMR